MSQSELAIEGFYDHEQEAGSRTPDWGGDDLFTAPAPRHRRFERSLQPTRLREEPHAPVREVHELPERRRPTPEPPEPRPENVEAVEPLADDAYMEPVPEGRRTVTITGRPDSFPVSRRPARTIDERIAHRPERIASWTCALGALSILLAIVTAQ